MRLLLTGALAVSMLAGALPLPGMIAPGIIGPAPARAQMDSREAIALQNQILELRRDMQSLRDQGGSRGGSSLGGRPPPPVVVQQGAGGDMTATLLDRVSRLEEEIRTMRGRLDEIDNARQQQALDFSKQIDDLNFKIDNSAGRPAGAAPPRAAQAAPPASATPTSPSPAAPSAAPAPAAVRRTPELAMQEGNAALARRDYATAEAAAREVLAAPKSPRATDAQFLLAQALTGKRDYQGAAVAYDDSYNRARTGTHAQDSLLGLSNSLTAIGEKRAACATLDKLRAEFPNPRQELRELISGARQRAGCR